MKKKQETARPGKAKGDRQYNSRTIAIAKVLYVDECKTLEQISDHFGGKPSKSTIEKWAKDRDREGKDWNDYRYEKAQELYRNLAPSERVRILHQKLDEVLSQKVGDPGKFADAVKKITSAITEIIDPRMNLPVIFQALDDLVGYVERTQGRSEKELRFWFAEVLKGFMIEVRNRIDGIPAPIASDGPPRGSEPIPQKPGISRTEAVQNDPERGSR